MHKVLRFFLSSVIIIGLLFAFLALPLLSLPLSDFLSLPHYTSSFTQILGIAISASGIGIAAFCVYTMRAIPLATYPPKTFVYKDFYAFVRNPIYLGHFCILLGEVFFLGTIPLIFFLFFYMIGIHFYVTTIEEPDLLKRFGQSYEQYMKTVPRWGLF